MVPIPGTCQVVSHESNIITMNTDIYSDLPRNQLQEAAGEITHRIADALKGIAKKGTSNAKDKLLAREIT